jgi:hypothetical protein
MSFVEDIRVSLSVRLASGTVKKIRAICGLGLEKPLANYDPNTRSWKMYEATLVSEDCPLLVNLPPSGMTRNGVLFLQRPWELITSEIESLSWPTPTAVTRPMEGNVRLYRAKVEAGEMTEAEAEAILGKSVWEAQGKLPAMWPTPRSSAAMADEMATSLDRVQRIGYKARLEEKVAMEGSPTGKLNPTWVEWLMGFPLGWTDLEDLETQ